MEASTQHDVIALIPAYMEAARIADTVSAARQISGVTRVVVIDDGSTDDTALLAEGAGAEVIRLAGNGGKGAALRAGMAACPGAADDILLLLDADLGRTASEAGKLLRPVLDDAADLTIARFPKVAGKAGFGLVKGLARWGTWLLTRNRLEAPISGQRACRRWVLDAAPIADGYGVELAMNIAAGDAGARIMEVPVEMTHNATGRNLRGFQHRGKQFVHILAALMSALFGRTGTSLLGSMRPGRTLAWFCALALLPTMLLTMPRLTPPLPWAGYLFLGTLAVLIGLVAAALFSGLFRARKKNYRGHFIPALGGVMLLPVSLFILHFERDRVFRLVTPSSNWLQEEFTVLVVLLFICWTMLGMLDDVKGDAQRKGFHGHLNALAHGKLTTGGVKLLAGGAFSLLSAWLLQAYLKHPIWLLPVTTLLIALSANAMNLFDLRPGRALKVSWLQLMPLFLLLPGPENLVMLVFFVLLATLCYAPFDFAGMMMLGDTGANPLGALIGVCLALVLPIYGQCLAVALLIVLHLYAERASITGTIERISCLRWLDQLGRG